MNRRLFLSSLVLVLLLSLLAPGAGAQELRLATGPMGGSWFPLGGAIAELIKEKAGVNVTVSPGGGVANVLAIETGIADLGFGNTASTVDGVMGREPFKSKTANTRYVSTLYRQFFQIVVREDSGIRSVADLKGKSIAPGPRGFTGEQIARHVLQVYGLSYADMSKVNHVGYNDAISLMRDGHLHAFMPITTIPASSIMDVASSHKIRLLSIPEEKVQQLKKINSGYARYLIPKGTYQGQSEDVVAVGTFTDLLVSAKLPDDMVYKLTRALVENKDRLSAVVKEIGTTQPKDMAPDLDVPYHPGALRYWREIKVK
jgi:TRAP transporter TAXI family solute receptor